jgi:hypothetical protein
MNEDMKGKKWSSKENTAKMINRKKERKKVKKETRPTNEAWRPWRLSRDEAEDAAGLAGSAARHLTSEWKQIILTKQTGILSPLF